MCGIAGIIARSHEVAGSAVEAMVAAQQHRGPDDQGKHIQVLGARVVGLGHARLSIIDLSMAGHQPMIHPGTGDVLVYNGEIYNHDELRTELAGQGCVFEGHSDTEVLLHGLATQGTDFIRKLEGMFAFAFLRPKNRDIVLARDPLGIKPLYLARVGGQLLFASEVRALLATKLVDPVLRKRAVAGYLAYGAVQAPDTLFQNITILDPGTTMTVSCSDLQSSSEQHWKYPGVDASIRERDAVEAFRETLERSVKNHLVSDVPVGVFLSSGFDSTAMASLAARHASEVRTFTVAMAEQPELDESTLAGETARRLGTQHQAIHVTMKDAEALALKWFADMDQPTMDGLNTYVISKAVKEHGVTVALSGQGGDELLCGYPSFGDVPRAMKIRKASDWIPSEARKMLAGMLAPGQTVAFREKARDLVSCDATLPALYLCFRRALSERQMSGLNLHPMDLGLKRGFVMPDILNSLGLPVGDPAAAVSILESNFYLGNMLLRDGDVFGMAHSLEIRVPMLDRRVLDLLYRVPGSVRMPTGRPGKHLLYEAFPDFFPPVLAGQEKRGFLLPIASWMAGSLRDLCVSGLEALKASGCVYADGVDHIWQIFEQDPISSNWGRTWTLCVLGIYLEKMLGKR